jgi:hypothetical protein
MTNALGNANEPARFTAQQYRVCFSEDSTGEVAEPDE